MKKLLLTSAIIMAAGAAQAMTPYASIKMGYMDNSVQAHMPGVPVDGFVGYAGFDGFAGSVAGGLGFDVESFLTLRGELEYSYARTSLSFGGDKVNLNANAVMVNGYADIGDAAWVVKPYVGFGLGYSFGSISEPGHPSESGDGGFAYSGMIGAAWHINSNFALDVSAKRWVNNGGIPNGGGSLDTKYIGTSYMLGARYSF
ncbi:MAG: porin family protein [Alphaproteobacteria bacterium]|nr:porin family protein [Alphaproteobacteria bacterium]